MDKVLRASKAGFACLRSLWYSVNAAEKGFQEQVSPKSQRIFDVGTALEPVIINWLINDGWDVQYNPGSQNAELEITVPVIGGFLKGHPDAIISKGEIKNALIDVKTMNERSFDCWRRQGTMKSKPQYVTQLHIYAMGLMEQGIKVEKLGIVGVNKNNSDMYMDFFDYNDGIALDITNRAELVMRMTEPPVYDCPCEKWACDYCEFSGICELHNAPRLPENLQKSDSPAPVTTDSVIIDAMSSLENARKLAKQARELEKTAKAELDENVVDKGISAIQGGGLLFELKQKASSKFDETAFKQAHPELVSTFMKETVSTTYSIKRLDDNSQGDIELNDSQAF